MSTSFQIEALGPKNPFQVSVALPLKWIQGQLAGSILCIQSHVYMAAILDLE